MESTSVEEKLDSKMEQGEKSAIIVQESTALNLLAQYTDSEDENDEKPIIDQRNDYRQAESSDSSSSSSDSEGEINVTVIRKKLEASMSSDDSESEEPSLKQRKRKPPIRVKGELLLEDLPPIQDLEIEVDENDCLEIGTITSIVDQLVLVEGYAHSSPLDIDSVLFIERGKKALGKIFDVIGPVSVPIYCVRFNSHDDIVSKNITVGNKVFCAPRTEYTSFVILSNIMCKGSDASWKNDLEIPQNMIEYSDDEQERKSRKPNKNHQERPTAVPRRRVPSQNYSWHNQINHQQQHQSNWNFQPQQQQQQQQYFQNYHRYPQNPYSQ